MKDSPAVPTLHEAMETVLREHGGWMDRDRIAEEIAAQSLWTSPSDGLAPPGDQIRLRARKYPRLFECSDAACTRIRLRRLAMNFGSTESNH